MGCDTVAALGRATVDGHTFFAHNCDRPLRECQALTRLPRRGYSPGEKVRMQTVELPQVRQTATVLGSRPEGCWGFTHGVNEHAVAVAATSQRTRLTTKSSGLLGTDLVRLTLERSENARQAVDHLTDLIERYGQGRGAATGEAGNNAFLIADAREAFAVETAGHYWVYQQVGEVRAVSNVCVVHQDWDRIARGLAGHAIEQGWWPSDGSKLDFAAAVVGNPTGEGSALRRWGRATMLLEQQNGHIDAAFLRRLLSDHYEGMRCEVDPLGMLRGPASLCQHPTGSSREATAASMVVQLDATRLLTVWCAFGPPCVCAYFPIFLEGDLPAPLAEDGLNGFWWRVSRLNDQVRGTTERWALARDTFSRLQARFDQEAEDFAVEGAALKQRGEHADLQRQANLFMQHNVEQFEEVADGLAVSGGRLAAAAAPM